MEEWTAKLRSSVEACPLLGPPSISMLEVLVGYLGVVALLGVVLPGPSIAGAALEDKSRLTYKCNGLASLVVLIAGLGVGIRTGHILPTVVAENGGQLCSTTLAFCLVMSVFVYLKGYLSQSKTASLRSHVTGNILHDWWFGVQLNPDFLGLDLKFFWIRTGMLGWFLINLSVAAKQFQNQGSLSLSMALYQAFSAIYVLDYFWHEEAMTSTWDIIAEKFGFMLIFGDVVFIPFTFSIQGWWLLSHSVKISKIAAALNLCIFLFGFAIFRGANKQKHKFKQDSKVVIWGQTAKVIGGRLLASGYWGVARHCNYLGDILVAFSFSLPCGMSSPVPYFYPAYLFTLLIWRERRDEARCCEKYREVWQEYCKAVPWRIFPGIY
ncbi:unnamed protein product [Sphagnum jensenii]|uniref:Uncharacterized protein n=2 Tax=Sphagnum jensenii TaxID=128206 RepID=A0ABP0WDY2_9BRYO